MRAAFTGDDMGGFVGENFVAGPAMHQRRGNVAHGARRQEHRGLLAEQIGHPLAQQAGVGRVWVSDNRLIRIGGAFGSRGGGV